MSEAPTLYVGHGAVALAIYATLSLALVASAIWIAICAVALRAGWVRLTSVLCSRIFRR
jgi:hypothetical protein